MIDQLWDAGEGFSIQTVQILLTRDGELRANTLLMDFRRCFYLELNRIGWKMPLFVAQKGHFKTFEDIQYIVQNF